MDHNLSCRMKMSILMDATVGAKSLFLLVFGLDILQCGELVKLAGMEMKKEDTEAITIFFSRFNDMLRRITQKPDYNFNPKNHHDG